MLIIDVKNGNIEKALKELKRKVYKTKQTLELFSRREYLKPSEIKHNRIKKARYIQQKKHS